MIPSDSLREAERSRRGEREVTVLFVDLLPAYTRIVSRQVQRHGGTVVERNGDGMMATFGALTALESKERAAVAAARAIVHELHRMKDPSGGRLPVAVGVATGAAWVGCIETADRTISSTVGDTTNLASRLQQLSRELSTPIIVDATTRRRAGALAGDFLCRANTTIRGCRHPLEVWLLPSPSGEAHS